MRTRLCDICGEKWIRSPADAYYMKRKILSFGESWSERMDVCADCMGAIKAIIKNYDYDKSTGGFTQKRKDGAEE